MGYDPAGGNSEGVLQVVLSRSPSHRPGQRHKKIDLMISELAAIKQQGSKFFQE
jgi:hypothetical protein